MTADDAPTRKAVLIVEDEPLLLMMAVDMVQDAGFEPLSATSADAAIDILVRRADVRVVFTDIDMPGSMDGLKLAAAVRDRWPPIGIIVTSGKLKPAELDMPPRTRFFAKPYDEDRLIATMQRMAA